MQIPCQFRYPIRQSPEWHLLTRAQVYKGKDEILLSKLILDPTHSILTQSYDSRLRLVLPRDMIFPETAPGLTAH